MHTFARNSKNYFPSLTAQYFYGHHCPSPPPLALCLLKDISNVPTWCEALKISFVQRQMYTGIIFATKEYQTVK
jgi:hypothetical protein